MKEAYFDANVYTHILNGQHGVTPDDVAKLHAAVRADKIRILASTALLEETICTILRSEKETVALLRLINKLTKHKKVIKYHFELLNDTVAAFVHQKVEPSPYMAPPYNFARVLRDHSAKHLDEIRKIAEETRKVIDERRSSTDELYSKIRPLAKEEIVKGQQQTFEDYYEIHVENVLNIFAEKAGLSTECTALGIRRLMNFKRVQVAVASHLSVGYENTYVRTKIDRGDSRDMHHAVLASATNTFITHDGRFTRALNRVPVQNFEVIDLKTLLSRIP